MLPQNQIELFSVDTFEGHSELDIKHQREGLQTPGLFSNTSYESVKKYLSDFDFVTVLKGRIQGFEKKFSKKDFTLIHLDMDLYEPTIYALNHYSENLVINGFFVIDDYKFESCPGIEKAIIDFLANHSDFIKIELITGQCILIKTRMLNIRAKNPGTGLQMRKTTDSKERGIENLKTF
jgi:O-methyltransferase